MWSRTLRPKNFIALKGANSTSKAHTFLIGVNFRLSKTNILVKNDMFFPKYHFK